MPIFSYLLVTCLKLLYHFHSNCPGIFILIVHQSDQKVSKVFIQCFSFYRSQCKGTPLLLLYILSEAINQIAFRKLTLLISCQCLILDAKQNFLYCTKNSSNCATCARLSRVYNYGIPGFLVVLDVVAKVTHKSNMAASDGQKREVRVCCFQCVKQTRKRYNREIQK